MITARLLFLALAILFVGSPTPRVLAQDSAKNVVVALKPDKNPDAMLAEKKQLSTYLQSKLGKPVDVIIPLSSSVILEGLANGSIDLAYVSATDMVNARSRKVADVLLVGEIEGKTSYHSYWLTLREKPYTKVEDLKGKPIAFASKTSTSGYVIPLWDLHQKGLVGDSGKPEEFFGKGNVIYGSGYVSAVERVLNGDAEAAAVSYYVLDKDKHLSVEQRGKLKMLAQQGPVPTHVLAVREQLSAVDKAALEAALLAMNDPSTSELRDKLFTSKLVKSTAEKHLSGLDSALQLARKGAE